MPAQTVIKLRRDTAANWDLVNPILASGEMGVETDTGLHKFGNGSSAWGALPYAASSKIVQQVKNASGSTMAKGSVVYISGATGGDALVTLADADSEMTSSKTLGLLATAIDNDAYGNVIEQGLLSGVDTSSATAGQSVWLSSTAGQFVFGNPPAKPAHSVYLGVVTRVHATEGEILVKVQNGYELNELHDVDAGSPTAGQVLQWDGDAWVNATLDALPAQTGNDGKYLTTDGTDASWAALDIPPGTQVSETAPPSPEEGQMWWNSATGTLYIYYDATWVEAVTGVVGPAGADGADGEPGVVAATAPITYNAETQTVAINQSAISITASQISDLTASATELNYVDGVTSSIQGQFDALPLIATGSFTASADQGVTQNTSVTFPISFPALPTVVLSMGDNSQAPSSIDAVAVFSNNVTSTGFTAQFTNAESGLRTVTVRWIAIQV